MTERMITDNCFAENLYHVLKFRFMACEYVCTLSVPYTNCKMTHLVNYFLIHFARDT